MPLYRVVIRWPGIARTAMTRSSQQTYIQRLGFQDKDRANPRHGLACEYLLEKVLKKNFATHIEAKAQAAVNYLREEVQEELRRIKPDLRRHEEGSAQGSFYSKEWHIESLKELAPRVERLQRMEEYLQTNTFNPQYLLNLFYSRISYSNYLNVPVSSGKFVNGFADVLIQSALIVSCRFKDQEPLDLDWTVYFDGFHQENAASSWFLGEVKITPEPAENIIQQIAFYRTFVSGVDEVIILVDYDAPQLKRMTQGSDIKVYRLGGAFEKWCTERPQPELEEF